MIIERLDSHAIARQNQPPVPLRPNREGEHAAKFGEAAEVPFEEGLQHGLGVARSRKFFSAGSQLFPQLCVIEDFAVENNDGVAVGAAKRLIAAMEVKDT